MKVRLIFLASGLAAVFSPTANAQCKESAVGTWKLVSVTAKTDKGDVDKDVLGEHPSGLLTYTGTAE